jgi:hypothetical protein
VVNRPTRRGNLSRRRSICKEMERVIVLRRSRREKFAPYGRTRTDTDRLVPRV